MEKINLSFKDSNIEPILDSIYESNIAVKLIKELNLSKEDVRKNYELILSYLKINKHCEKCKSMNECDHSTKGYFYQLKKDMDNQLTDCFIICKQYENYYQRKQNLLYTTFDENELLSTTQMDFLFDNVNLLGKSFLNKIASVLKGNKVCGDFIVIKNSKVRLKLIKALAYGLLSKNKVAIVKFSSLLQNIKAEFNNTDANSLKIVLESDILIIDGLGNESITTWSRDEILLTILDQRIQNEKTTFLCSEFTLDELKKLYKLSYNDEVKANQIIEKIKEIKM